MVKIAFFKFVNFFANFFLVSLASWKAIYKKLFVRFSTNPPYSLRYTLSLSKSLFLPRFYPTIHKIAISFRREVSHPRQPNWRICLYENARQPPHAATFRLSRRRFAGL